MPTSLFQLVLVPTCTCLYLIILLLLRIRMGDFCFKKASHSLCHHNAKSHIYRQTKQNMFRASDYEEPQNTRNPKFQRFLLMIWGFLNLIQFRTSHSFNLTWAETPSPHTHTLKKVNNKFIQGDKIARKKGSKSMISNT